MGCLPAASGSTMATVKQEQLDAEGSVAAIVSRAMGSFQFEQELEAVIPGDGAEEVPTTQPDDAECQQTLQCLANLRADQQDKEG